MKAEKDQKTGKWLIQYRYTDWQGNRKKSTKRGFATKREAEEWLRQFLLSNSCDFNMKFEKFIDLYFKDCETRLKKNTIRTKKYIVDLKIIPYFGQLKMNEITAVNIRSWQNLMMKKEYSQTYLKTLNNQLSAIFNHAVRLYGLKYNPCRKAGSIGKSKAEEMSFWTKEEFKRFIDAIMNKQVSYMSFMLLYWTGIRLGELLALTAGDIDFEKKTISINKSYQRIDKEDVITSPKTPKSKRLICIPDFLMIDLKDYVCSVYGSEDSDCRLFHITKSYLEHEIARGVKKSGVKKIRIHDLRHSHASLLIEMGIPILEVASRLGHEKVETTLNTYGHLYPNKQQQLADKLDKIYAEDLR